MMTELMREIILDEKHAQGLVGIALREGLARVVEAEGDSFADYKRLWQAGRKALAYTLLYPNVTLYSALEGLVDLSALGEHVPIQTVFPASVEAADRGPSYLGTEEGLRLARGMKSVLIPRLRRETRDALPGLRVGSRNYDSLIDALSYRDLSFSKRGLMGAVKTARDSRLLRIHLDAVSRETGKTLEKTAEAYRNRMMVDTGWKREFITTVAGHVWVIGQQIVEAIMDTVGIVSLADQRGACVASSWDLPRSFTRGEAVRAQDAALRCYYIFLEEVDQFPEPKTLAQVLRLRDDKRIRAWRHAVNSWIHEIRDGNASSEKRVRSQIRTAVRDVQRLVPMRKISGIMAVLAVPVAIAEMLIGTLGAGYALTVASGGVESWAKFTRRKHRWLLLGSARS